MDAIREFQRRVKCMYMYWGWLIQVLSIIIMHKKENSVLNHPTLQVLLITLIDPCIPDQQQTAHA